MSILSCPAFRRRGTQGHGCASQLGNGAGLIRNEQTGEECGCSKINSDGSELSLEVGRRLWEKEWFKQSNGRLVRTGGEPFRFSNHSEKKAGAAFSCTGFLRACLISRSMPNGREFCRQARQIFAGILGGFQENFTQYGGKRPAGRCAERC